MLILKGHATGQTVHSVAFSPDGHTLASCSLDNTIRLWDTHAGTNQIVGTLCGYFSRSVVFAPDGRMLAWGDHPLDSQRWQVSISSLSGGPWSLFRLENSEYYYGDFKVRYSPDGRLLAAAGDDVHLWDAATEKRLTMWGDGTVTGCLAFSPDSGTLAVGHSHRNARNNRLRHELVLYHPTTRRLHGTLSLRRRARDVTFAPNGRTLAAACENMLSVWELPAEKPVFECQGGKRHFQGIAFTPDSRFLAATHNDRTVRMWDTREWSERAAFDWGIGEVTCIAFAPDGLRAAVGGRTGRIVIWDVDL